MKRSIKKILSLALAGSMVLGMLSISSLAEDNTDSVIMDGAEIVVNPDRELLPEAEEFIQEEQALTDAPEAEEPDAGDKGIQALDETTDTHTAHRMTVTVYRVVNGSLTGESEELEVQCDGGTGTVHQMVERKQFHPTRLESDWGTEDWLGYDFGSEWTGDYIDVPFNKIEYNRYVRLEDGDNFYLVYGTPTYIFRVVYLGAGGTFANGETTLTDASGEITDESWTTSVTSEEPRQTCHRFTGWTRNINGSSVPVPAGDPITVSVGGQENTVYLSANWEEIHNFSEEYVSDGENHWHVCADCGIRDENSVESHTYTEVLSTTAPTCTEAGEEIRACVCGAETSVPVGEALGHSFSENDYGHDETHHWLTCERPGCDAREEEAEHSWDEGKETVAPGCDTTGIYTYTCTLCGRTRDEEISALGHQWDSEWSHDENGHWHSCANCGEKKDETEHSWTEVGIITGATCERDGVRRFTCRVCGEDRDEEIPALGHDMGEWEVVREATTSEEGERARVCNRPGCDHRETEVIARLPGGSGSGSGSGSNRPSGGSGSGSSGSGSSSSRPSTPSSEQPEEDLPEEDLEDEDVPLAELPFPFEDVTEKDWFYGSVKYVYGKGMMASVLKSRYIFEPMTDTTRNMVVTVLYRLDSTDELSELKVPLAGEPVQFSDQMAIPVWAREAVAWGVANGVIEGYRDGSFGGERNITRQELAAMLYRYAGMKGCDMSVEGDLSVFEDAESIAPYAREAMRWAVGAGIIKGMSDTWLNPTGTASRAHVAATLERFCVLVSGQKSVA